MSRTYRRNKKTRHPAWKFLQEKYFVLDLVWTGTQYVRVAPEVDELNRRKNRFHSDNLRCDSGSDTAKQDRVFARSEMARWMRDPDHEIIIPKKNKLVPYWA